MVIDLLSYSESFLNPFLKLLTPVLLLVGCYYFYLSYTKYGGEMKTIATLLLVCGLAGVASGTFRFMGDYVTLWKWGESVLFLIFAVICGYVAMRMLELFKIFSPTE